LEYEENALLLLCQSAIKAQLRALLVTEPGASRSYLRLLERHKIPCQGSKGWAFFSGGFLVLDSEEMMAIARGSGHPVFDVMVSANAFSLPVKLPHVVTEQFDCDCLFFFHKGAAK
jgi:hypothetical protein